MNTVTLNIKESNGIITNLLKNSEIFLITRLGDAVSEVSINILMKYNISPLSLSNIQTHDGIYCKSKDKLDEIIIFAQKYNEAIKNSTYIACFPNLYTRAQNIYIHQFSLTALHNRALEPFYCILENEQPWSHTLITKKVLIISPFVNSFKKQLTANFQIFKDKYLFLPGQSFVFYKSYNSLANNKPHNNWIETFEIMCQDIQKLDFDVALLGCGGYGLPIANFIKEDLNKSAIYIGGGLQLLFGVMGGRWKNNPLWEKIIIENQSKFISPSDDEIIHNSKMIEDGCYW